MNAIVIKRKLAPDEITYIINLIDNSSDYKIFSETDLPEQLKNYNIEKYDTDFIPKREINYQTLKLINDFGDKIIENKAISEHLTFEKAGIWYYHKFRIYFVMLDLFYELNEINHFSGNFEKVYFYSAKNEIKLYKNIPTNVNIQLSGNKTKNKLNLKTLLNYFIFFILRIIISFFKTNYFKHKKHLIIDHTPRQIYIDINTLKEKKGNYNLIYLFDKSDKDFVILREVMMPKFKNKDTFKLRREYFCNNDKHQKRIFGEFIIFLSMFNFKISKEKKIVLNKLKDTYRLFESQNLNADEVMIIKYLKAYHNTTSYYLTKYFAFKDFLKRKNIISVSSIDENSAVIKTIMDSAKSLNIKTIGIQHGNIHDLHPAYIFTQLDKQNKVMCDYTLIWGKYYKDFLKTKGNYPEDSLKIVGQIRTDIIPRLNNVDKNLINPTIFNPAIFNLQSEIINRRIILFASQPQRDSALRYKSAFDVFSAMKDINDAFLIIKLHPAEFNDFSYYEGIAKEAACTNFKIIYYYDLYLLLSASDIVITCFSTVGSEAVYFSKPLIILDHLKQDIQNYHKAGVAFQATNAIELKDFINKILDGQLQINQQACKDFIENYACKIDGQVSSRCIDFIKSLSQ